MNSFERKHASKTGSSILVPCSKHGKLPDTTVCGSCLAETGEFVAVAQDTLVKMPQVYGELFSEGMMYFQALEMIAKDPNIKCVCPSGLAEDGTVVHEENCAVWLAREAIQGYGARILHRPAEGKLAELRKDAAKWATKPE